MSGGFIGRGRELATLRELLDTASTGARNGRPGRAILVRGRRRVGKSRLVEEFLRQHDLPHVYFTANAGSREGELAAFAAEVAASNLPDAAQFGSFDAPSSWDAAFTLLASVLPADRPSAVVIDELPYLIESDSGVEGALQKVFDRLLSRTPTLLILIGSDLAMMEHLNTYGRPFYQRGTEMVVPPLNPADIAALLKLPAARAFDAFLITGGLPLILEEWPSGGAIWDYLAHAVSRPTSALLVSAERALAAEFPTQAQAQTVLSAIGSGERTFSMIARAAGDLNPTSLQRSLRILSAKRMVEADLPLSTKPSKETRYRAADPYLRFWLTFLGPNLPLIERGRGDQVLDVIQKNWTAWRGRVIEPVVREALWRLSPDRLPEGTDVIGGYWTRTNDPEIDIVGADRAPIAKRITAVGSIKWLERKPFGPHDLSRLIVHRAKLPGAATSTPLVAVSRVDTRLDGVRIYGPSDLIEAWA